MGPLSHHGTAYGLIREREYLEEGAVESQQILVDESVSGLNVVVGGDVQKGAKLVVAVVGEPMPV
jgi:hypothetical protein